MGEAAPFRSPGAVCRIGFQVAGFGPSPRRSGFGHAGECQETELLNIET